MKLIQKLRGAGRKAGCLLVLGGWLASAEAADLHFAMESDRIVKPGEEISVSISDDSSEAQTWDLFLRNEVTEELTPLKSVAVSSDAAKLAFPLKAEGLYSIWGKAKGQSTPENISSGYFLATPRKADAQAAATPIPALQFGSLFRDDAVLQRDKPLPVWGWATPGDEVTVSLSDQEQKAKSDESGRWQVEFKPLPAGGPFELKAVSSSGKSVAAKDVLIGEVWVLSGQSNMGGELPTCIGGKEAAEKANFPDVRIAPILGVPGKEGQLSPVYWQKAVSGGDPAQMKKWGGIHFAFGTELNEALKVPVGLLAASRGGTSLYTWTSRELHKTNPVFQPILEQYEKDKKSHDIENQYLSRLANSVAKWRQDSKKAKEAGKPAPNPPNVLAAFEEKNAPGLLYHQLIEPMAPFAIRGVLWYQGENDTGLAEAYRKRFPAMIESWRELWKNPDMPFLFVQLAYNSGTPLPGDPNPPLAGADAGWAELREAQTMTLSLPHTAMVVSYDLVRPENNVHYNDKIPVGHRAALAALATVYGKDVKYQSPLYREMKVEDGKIRVFFDHTEGGLKAKGGKLGGFAIAGEDRNWVWADAEIDGETVVVHSDKVPHPVAVRYSWTTTMCGANLYNSVDLPASSFRTDDWPMASAGKL